MCLDSLPASDCHSALRKDLLLKEPISTERLCISVAWDWLFRGFTASGIDNEISTSLSSTKIGQQHRTLCLGIPETVLLNMAKQMITQCDSQKEKLPAPKTVLKGIKRSLFEVVDTHSRWYSKFQTSWNDTSVDDFRDKKHLVTIENKTDANISGLNSINPYSNDFYCIICHKELSNMYLHCFGCDKLLGKDYNLCMDCHGNKEYENLHEMHHEPDESMTCNAKKNHTGAMPNVVDKDKRKKKGKCTCDDSVENCDYCELCTGCSCTCHTNFMLRFRCMTIEDEKQLCEKVKDIVNGDSDEDADDEHDK